MRNKIKTKKRAFLLLHLLAPYLLGSKVEKISLKAKLNNKERRRNKSIKKYWINKCNIFQDWKQSRNKIKTNLNNFVFILCCGEKDSKDENRKYFSEHEIIIGAWKEKQITKIHFNFFQDKNNSGGLNNWFYLILVQL